MTSERIAYNYEDAATQLGVSPRTIVRAVADGDLTVHRLRGTTPRILHEDLVQWVTEAPAERP